MSEDGWTLHQKYQYIHSCMCDLLARKCIDIGTYISIYRYMHHCPTLGYIASCWEDGVGFLFLVGASLDDNLLSHCIYGF